jgi:Trk-type K+ transport system membrane component
MPRRPALTLGISLVLLAAFVLVAGAVPAAAMSPEPSSAVATVGPSGADAGTSPTPAGNVGATIVILIMLLGLGSLPIAMAWRRGWRPHGGF